MQRAVDEHADLSMFRGRPAPRLLVGLGLLGLSMLLGWPAVALMAVLAVAFEEPLIGVVGGPAIYAFSWLIYGAGILVAGWEVLKYMHAFNRWSARRLVEWLVGEQPS
ncbi:MAG: hypothetical protein JXR96_12590 [Deltaproteobacteria bacterium]|nr:hypothetical protein [Deltaproteobacteria bacterium]